MLGRGDQNVTSASGSMRPVSPFFITAIIIFFSSTVNFLKYFSINVVSQLAYILAKHVNT